MASETDKKHSAMNPAIAAYTDTLGANDKTLFEKAQEACAGMCYDYLSLSSAPLAGGCKQKWIPLSA